MMSYNCSFLGGDAVVVFLGRGGVGVEDGQLGFLSGREGAVGVVVEGVWGGRSGGFEMGDGDGVSGL